MKVRISGFQLTYHAKLNIDTPFNALVKKQNERIKWPPHERVLRVRMDGDLVLGSLLTDRGHRAFVALDKQSNALSRGQLAPGKNFGAFSFFILCRKKPAAIITSYRDAGGPSFVFGLLDKIGDEAMHQERDVALKAEGQPISAKQRKRIIDAYKGPSLKWVEYLGRSEYDAVLRQWQRIKAIEIAYNVASAPAAFVPFDNADVETTQLRVSFKPGTAVSRAVDHVKELWDSRTVAAREVIKVDGVDDLGFLRKVEIKDKIPTLLGELDHDTVVRDATSFADDLSNSYVIRHLKHLVSSNPAIFAPRGD